MTQLGEMLRRERVGRGLTFKEVEQRLHIRSSYLEALEDGQYDLIPGDVYTKGFIRNYGNFLGLDGASLVEVYKKNYGKQDDLGNLQVKIKDDRPATLHEGARISLEEVEGQRRLGPSSNRWLAVLIGLLLVALFAWIIY